MADYGDVVTIMRRIIGRASGNDPDASDDTLLRYASDFVSLIMGEDIKSFDLFDHLTIQTVADQDEYDFEGKGFTNIEPKAFVDGLSMNYFQNPNDFDIRWPDVPDQDTQTGKPQDLLFYGETIKLRPIPDDEYEIKIVGYKKIPSVASLNEDIPKDYMLRYIAYGGSLDWLSDFGEYEILEKAMPIYERYKSLVVMRQQIKTETKGRNRRYEVKMKVTKAMQKGPAKKASFANKTKEMSVFYTDQAREKKQNKLSKDIMKESKR